MKKDVITSYIEDRLIELVDKCIAKCDTTELLESINKPNGGLFSPRVFNFDYLFKKNGYEDEIVRIEVETFKSEFPLSIAAGILADLGTSHKFEIRPASMPKTTFGKLDLFKWSGKSGQSNYAFLESVFFDNGKVVSTNALRIMVIDYEDYPNKVNGKVFKNGKIDDMKYPDWRVAVPKPDNRTTRIDMPSSKHIKALRKARGKYGKNSYGSDVYRFENGNAQSFFECGLLGETQAMVETLSKKYSVAIIESDNGQHSLLKWNGITIDGYHFEAFLMPMFIGNEACIVNEN